MVFGQAGSNWTFLEPDNMTQPQLLVKNAGEQIEILSKEIKNMSEITTKRLLALKTLVNEKENKNRTQKLFKPNDIVFVLDRSIVVGAPRPLKLKFSNSPYLVLRPLFTTTLVKRLSDGFISLYNNDSIKKYMGGDPILGLSPKKLIEFSCMISKICYLTTFQQLPNLTILTYLLVLN